MSRFQASPAERKKVRVKMGISGPSGAGKTVSALMIAHGLQPDWSKIGVLDVENGSALFYHDREFHGTKVGAFQHIPFNPPYSPQDYIEAITYAESLGITVLVIDSITHEWSGLGGCLEIMDRLAKGSRSGSTFNVWKEVTPMHNAFMDKLRLSDLHIIATMRAKSDYVIEQNDKGRSTPKKVGLKSEQREGTEYEFGLVFNVSIEHYATADKDRTGLFAPRPPFVVTPDTGRELLAWAESGVDFDPTFNIKIPEHKAMLSQYCADLGLDDAWKAANSAALLRALQNVTIGKLRSAVEDFANG